MQSNNELVDELVRRGALTTPTIIVAFQAVDRKYFVPSGISSLAYEDHPLDIGYKATISQPTTVAFMLEKLARHWLWFRVDYCIASLYCRGNGDSTGC